MKSPRQPSLWYRLLTAVSLIPPFLIGAAILSAQVTASAAVVTSETVSVVAGGGTGGSNTWTTWGEIDYSSDTVDNVVTYTWDVGARARQMIYPTPPQQGATMVHHRQVIFRSDFSLIRENYPPEFPGHIDSIGGAISIPWNPGLPYTLAVQADALYKVQSGISAATLVGAQTTNPLEKDTNP